MKITDISINQCLYFPVKSKRWKYPRVYSGVVRKVAIEAANSQWSHSSPIESVWLSTDEGIFVRSPDLCFERAKDAQDWILDRARTEYK